MTTYHVGPKKRHVTVSNYHVKVRGAMRRGDKVANIYNGELMDIDHDDVGQDADIYELVCSATLGTENGVNEVLTDNLEYVRL